MKVSEAFLVNTKNFETIINALVSQNTGEVINSNLLEELGFSDPNDLLVVRILKDFDIIDNNGKPSKHYQEFKNPNTTKAALARGLVSAYEKLFKEYPKIHHAPPDKVKQAFEEIFEGRKTDLIIKYISGTFQKVATYVEPTTIDAVLQGESVSVNEPVVAEAELSQNGNNGSLNSSEKQTETVSQQISSKSINDLINNFEKQQNPTASSDDEEKNTLSVQEHSKGNEEPEDEDDDPFNFVDEDSSQPSVTPNTETIDMAPSDLDIPLSSSTQSGDKPTEHEFVQKALIRKSDLLQKMNRWEELVPTLEEIIKRYDNKEYPGLSEAVSRSIIRRAVALLKLHRTDEALPALNSVITRFKDSENKEFFDQASRAMLYKTTILEKKGSEDLLPLYNAIIERLDGHSDIFMREKLDEIHLKRFDLIINKGESSEIFEASTKLIQRFKDRNEHRIYLQKAMIIRAEMLDEMGHEEEALAAYDQFLKAFGN